MCAKSAGNNGGGTGGTRPGKRNGGLDSAGNDGWRDEIRQRNLEHPTEFYLLISEDQALDVAAGVVPLVVQAQARTMLDWLDQDRRNSERPYRRKGKRS